MLNEELAFATMREAERQAAKFRRSEKATQQAEQPRASRFTRSVQRLPLLSFKTASAL